MESYLSIESIWEDDDLFEVRVSASNGDFSGQTNCYTNREEIEKLGLEIEGFPKQIGHEFTFSTSENDDMSFFTLRLRCIDGSGHILGRVKIAHIVTFSNAEKEKYLSEFDIKIEPSAIDTFSKAVKSLSKASLGEVKATLKGKT